MVTLQTDKRYVDVSSSSSTGGPAGEGPGPTVVMPAVSAPPFKFVTFVNTSDRFQADVVGFKA